MMIKWSEAPSARAEAASAAERTGTAACSCTALTALPRPRPLRALSPTRSKLWINDRRGRRPAPFHSNTGAAPPEALAPRPPPRCGAHCFTPCMSVMFSPFRRILPAQQETDQPFEAPPDTPRGSLRV